MPAKPNPKLTLKQYQAKAGARLNQKEAQTVGEAMEKLRKQLKRSSFTTPEFARFCEDPNQPVHRVWKRVRDSIEKRAGLEAAAYLIRSVVVIPYGEVSETAARPVVVIGPPETDKTTVYPAEIVASSANLLAEYEEQFRTSLRGLMRGFVSVAAFGKLRRVTLEVLGEFNR